MERQKQWSPGCRCRRRKQKAIGTGPSPRGPWPSCVVFRSPEHGRTSLAREPKILHAASSAGMSINSYNKKGVIILIVLIVVGFHLTS